MSRPRAEAAYRPPAAPPSGSPGVLAPILAALVLVLAAVPAGAQAVTTGVPTLTPAAQEALVHLQEGWLQWTGALYGGDGERALAVVDDLLETAGQLGMDRLPDLAAGAALQAVEAAREGHLERAEVALTAAERFDRGRPETAFAAAEVARVAGHPLGRAAAQLRGYSLALTGEALRAPVLVDMSLWGLLSLLVAGGLFLVLLMLTGGRAVINDLGRGLARRLPRLPGPAIQILIVVALLWPLALPWGPIWLFLYWSVLLWRHAAPSERTVLTLVWLLLGVSPWLGDLARERLALKTSPPVRAMDSIAQGRLYGGLFIDLQVLPVVLPDHPAVDQLLGDLHLRFDQWDAARRRYEAVLEREPENVDALIDLGAYSFNRGDYGNAVARFQQAASLDPDSAVAHFDLSLAYAESYLFDENREALLEARRIDEEQVSEWLRRPERQRIVTVEGGVARRDEIEDALAAAWTSARAASSGFRLLHSVRSLLVVMGVVGLALALLAVLQRLRWARPGPRPMGGLPGYGDGSGVGAIVPGLDAASEGRGFAAFFAVLVPAALIAGLLATLGRGFVYPVPWRYDPGSWLLIWAGALGLGSLTGVRVIRALRGRG